MEQTKGGFSWKAFAAGATVVASAVIAAGLIAMLGGYNVAASAGHSPVGQWVLDTTMHRSVKARADGPAPVSFTEGQVETGFSHYDETCVICHGGPGVEPAEWAQAMTPPPPDLAHAAQHWEAPELFWIVKHGIKMTAMPAFGEHHGDGDLWAIVAFLQTLPELDDDAYRVMQEGAPEHTEGS